MKRGNPGAGRLGESPAPGAAAAAGPGRTAGPAAPARPATPPGGVVFHFNGSPSFGGSLVAGDQHGVSGGQVTGDVHQGGSGGESA